MNAKKAFTLIELLVVIAIIAILAAILFPVFAQAKEAAKKTACLSNEKQLSLGILMYLNDFDDTYPMGTAAWGAGFAGDWEASNWAVATLPYIKSNGIFGDPDDSDGGKVDPNNAWEGIMMSYAVNGLIVPYEPSTSDQYCQGLMCEVDLTGAPWGQSVNSSTVNQPASVIALSESWSSQMSTAGAQINYSAGFGGIFTGYQYFEAVQLPNQCGTVNSTTTCGNFPYGMNGGVSTHGGNKANFGFADGHTKSLTPAATVPNSASPATGYPNFWTWGQYDTGANDSTPSMWQANHS